MGDTGSDEDVDRYRRLRDLRRLGELRRLEDLRRLPPRLLQQTIFRRAIFY